LWNRKSNNIDDLTKLHALLVRQHTMRIIVFIVHALKNKVSFNALLELVGRLRNDRFSIVIFWDIVMSAIKKRLGYRMNVCDT